MKRSLTLRLMLLFSLLLAAFTVLTAVIYNALMVRQSITHHSQAMQRDAFAIAQNLSELVAPSAYDASLDETRFIVSEENLPPYLALTEQLTRCNVYLVDSHHNVTGYFDGVVQVLERRETPISANDQREMVRGMLREKKQNEAYVRWAEDIRGRAYVEFRDAPQ